MRICVERRGNAAHVDLEGKFDFSARQKIRKLREELTTLAWVREIVFDLNRVTHIDSAALGMMMLVREAAEEAQKRLSLECEGGRVREILEVANLKAMLVH
jgi:anti-anti-sigma factor